MEKEFETEWQRYCEAKGGGAVTMNIKEVARHFAKWQKEREQKELQLAEEHGILSGMNMEREKLMKDAINGWIEGDCREQEDEPYDVYAVSDSLDTTKFKIGDKVKVIIVKE